MHFENRTPFDALCFSAIDRSDKENRVVAVRVRYLLQHLEGDRFEAELVTDPDQSPALVLADAHHGKPGLSSIERESDLAPYKPKCDVTVQGHSYAPDGQLAQRWRSRLRVWSRREPAEVARVDRLDDIPLEMLIDKSIEATGPGRFVRGVVGYHAATLELARSTPLLWEYAFGGSCLVPSANQGEPAEFHEVCFANPVGCGWIHPEWLRAMERGGAVLPEHLPVPRLRSVGEQFRTPERSDHGRGPMTAFDMAAALHRYGHLPTNLAPTGRAWAPRLALAGTYDDQHIRDRHPGLPADFDYRYWNHAPEDQQIDPAAPDLAIELVGLTPPERTPTGTVRTRLPGHRAFLQARGNHEQPFLLPMQIDTVSIDGDAMTIDVVWRGSVLDEHRPRWLKLCFGLDPAKPFVETPSLVPISESDG